MPSSIEVLKALRYSAHQPSVPRVVTTPSVHDKMLRSAPICACKEAQKFPPSRVFALCCEAPKASLLRTNSIYFTRQSKLSTLNMGESLLSFQVIAGYHEHYVSTTSLRSTSSVLGTSCTNDQQGPASSCATNMQKGTACQHTKTYEDEYQKQSCFS